MSAAARFFVIPDSSIQRRRNSKAALMSGSEAVSFCFGILGDWTVTIASPPIRSKTPRHKRSEFVCPIWFCPVPFRAEGSGSVAMSWNFRLELPELSTRTFICRHQQVRLYPRHRIELHAPLPGGTESRG